MSAAAKEYIVAARKFAAQFKGFLSIAEELEKIESFDLAVSEVQQRLEALRQEEEQRQAKVLAIIADAQKAARMIEDEARADAAAIRRQSETERAAAAAHADEIVQNAQSEVETHQGLVTAARARVVELEQKAEAMLAHHADLDVKTAAKTAELERIESARTTALASLGFTAIR